MDNKYFDCVLDDDEKIIKTIKPNKLKVYFSNCLKICWPLLFVFIFFIIGAVIPDAEVDSANNHWIVVGVFGGILLFFIILSIIFSALYLKNTIYALTNKRLIIRTGMIGVDFKCLDYKNLGASDVYVSLIDKLLHKNTGTLRFGNASSPIGVNNFYCFANVVEPYNLYKEIKQYIASSQQENKQDVVHEK